MNVAKLLIILLLNAVTIVLFVLFTLFGTVIVSAAYLLQLPLEYIQKSIDQAQPGL